VAPVPCQLHPYFPVSKHQRQKFASAATSDSQSPMHSWPKQYMFAPVSLEYFKWTAARVSYPGERVERPEHHRYQCIGTCIHEWYKSYVHKIQQNWPVPLTAKRDLLNANWGAFATLLLKTERRLITPTSALYVVRIKTLKSAVTHNGYIHGWLCCLCKYPDTVSHRTDPWKTIICLPRVQT
jgi:hypothetical protein